MRLEETRNTYRIVVNVSWRVVIFKTVKVGTSILVNKVSRRDTASEGNSASYGRIILKLKVKEGLQYAGWLQMAGRFNHNNQFKVLYIQHLNEMSGYKLTSGRM
jgi:hypothetical protein